MIELFSAQLDLFDPSYRSRPESAEASIFALFSSRWDGAVSRLTWCNEHLLDASERFNEVEDEILLGEATACYLFGAYAAAIIAADAFLERLISDVVEAEGTRQSAKVVRGGFGPTLDYLLDGGPIHTEVVKCVRRLHSVRNALVHQQAADQRMRLAERERAVWRPTSEILHDDAREAVCISYGLANQIQRSFPRAFASIRRH